MFRPLLRASFRGILSTPSQLRTLATKRQHSLPAAYYRGGTSRAVFFKQNDLPHDRKQWDPIFRSVIGSPDPYGRQLDGMGGGISSLSKVCVVGEPTHPDADVDYTFIALGVDNPEVDYSSNCGNMSSAVGPFAVDSGLFGLSQVQAGSDSVSVRVHNTNTGKIIRSSFPVVEGEAAASGDFAIDGVAGTASRVQLDFVDPAGSRTGKLLPTGQVKDTFDGVPATCIDVGNPCVFVRAVDLGVKGNLSPDEITTHPDLLPRLDSIRRQAGVKMGLVDTLQGVPGSVPKISIVSSPGSDSRSTEQTAGQVDLLARALSVGQPHKAVPITVALALASAARLQGSTVAEVASTDRVDAVGVTIGHASGNLLVGATFNENGDLDAATVFRTTRRLFEGRIFWKNES